MVQMAWPLLMYRPCQADPSETAAVGGRVALIRRLALHMICSRDKITWYDHVSRGREAYYPQLFFISHSDMFALGCLITTVWLAQAAPPHRSKDSLAQAARPHRSKESSARGDSPHNYPHIDLHRAQGLPQELLNFLGESKMWTGQLISKSKIENSGV